MGREVRRVKIDFDWPVGKIWPGFLIGICYEFSERDNGCDICKDFAKRKGIHMTSYGCPDYDAFVGPPVGDGWQMWENTSEGSPISPVFETPEELAQWLVDNNASAFGSMTLVIMIGYRQYCAATPALPL